MKQSSSTTTSKQQLAAPPFSTQNVAAKVTKSLANGLACLYVSIFLKHSDSIEQKEIREVVKARYSRIEAALVTSTANLSEL